MHVPFGLALSKNMRRAKPRQVGAKSRSLDSGGEAPAALDRMTPQGFFIFLGGQQALGHSVEKHAQNEAQASTEPKARPFDKLRAGSPLRPPGGLRSGC